MLNDEQVKELVRKELEIKSRALAVFPKVREVIQKFDQKVFNKRLETALKEVDPNIRVHCEHNSFDIKYCAWEFEDRSITVDHGAYYVKNDSVYIVAMCVQSGYDDKQNAFDDDRRIMAKNMLANMDRIAGQINESIVSIDYDLHHIDDYRKRYNELMAAIKDHNDFISYTVRQYFDLEVKTRW